MGMHVSINSFSLEWIFGFIWIFVWLIFSAVFSYVVASIARRKGYSFGGFFLFGIFAFVPALIVVLILPYKGRAVEVQSETSGASESTAGVNQSPSPKQCQYCASLNLPGVLKCQNCGAPLPMSN